VIWCTSTTWSHVVWWARTRRHVNWWARTTRRHVKWGRVIWRARTGCRLTWCVRTMIRHVIWHARTLRCHVIWWVCTDVSAERAAFTFSVQDLLFRREIGQQASPILWYISNKLHGVTSQKMLVLLIIFFSSEVKRTYRMAEEQVIALLVYESIAVYGIKTNWCHCFNFIRILPDLYMFRAHRPIFRRVHTAVHTTIGSVSLLLWSRALYVIAVVRPSH